MTQRISRSRYQQLRRYRFAAHRSKMNRHAAKAAHDENNMLVPYDGGAAANTLDKAKDTITTSFEEATEYATETLIKTAAGDNEEAALLLRKLPATLSAANSRVDELAGSPPSTLQELQAIV